MKDKQPKSGPVPTMQPVPQVDLQTSGYGGMGYTPVLQTFTPAGRPSWMQGDFAAPWWGMSAANPQQRLTQADLQPPPQPPPQLAAAQPYMQQDPQRPIYQDSRDVWRMRTGGLRGDMALPTRHYFQEGLPQWDIGSAYPMLFGQNAPIWNIMQRR